VILAALLLAQAAPQSAIDAERAFAADAQKDGQWTAFRRWAADDAIMFDPKPINAQALLKPLKDPPKAITWAPAESFVSCDGQVAVNTGPWTRPNGTVGYFTTVWKKQPDGAWKWVLDHGDGLKTPREAPAKPKVMRADCAAAPQWETEDDAPGVTDTGASQDSTLIWRWTAWPDGSREFTASLWNGERWAPVIEDKVAVPPA
jgi:ketosteroid isomerase-like protein